MTDKELRKLKRQTLLEMLLAQSEELEELKARCEEQTSSSAELQATVGYLKARLEDKDAQLEKLEVRLEGKDEKMRAVKEQLAQKMDDLERLRERLDRKDDELSAARERLDSLVLAEKADDGADALPEGETPEEPPAKPGFWRRVVRFLELA